MPVDLSGMSPVRTPRTVELPALARRTRDLLLAGVPLSLLIDLCEPGGPHSRDLYVRERDGLAVAR